MQYSEVFDPNSFIQERKNTEFQEEFSNNAINSDFKPEEREKFIEIRSLTMFQKSRSEYEKVVSADEAFDECGGFGRHQWLIFIMMIMAMKSAGFFLNGFSFLELEPHYECLNQKTKSWYVCTKQNFCNDKSLEYRPDWTNTETLYNFIMHFDMQCSESWEIGLMGSFFLVGIVIGCLTLTRLGDILGRKPVFIVGMLLQICVSISIVLLYNKWANFGLCAVMGLALTGKQYVGYTYLLENMPKSKQVIVGSFEFMLEAVTIFLICAFYLWVSKDWRFLMIPTLVLSLIGTIFMLFQPESPRFLVSKGRFDEARKVFNIIAKRNGKGENFADNFIFKEEIDQISLQQNAFEKLQDNISSLSTTLNDSFSSDGNKSKHSMREIFKTRAVRINFIFACLIWSAIVFNFFLVSFYFKYFPGNIFMNTIYFSIADLFSYLASGLIVRCLHTSKTLILAQTLSSIGAILYLVFYDNEIVVPIVIVLSRIGNSMSFNTVYVTNNRLFPTHFQTSSLGLLNFISHIIAIGAPQVAEIKDPLPFSIFLGNALLALISAFFVKEIYYKKGKEVDYVVSH